MTRAVPKSEPVDFWHYTGQPMSEWPEWVFNCCETINGELIHTRRSGGQVLHVGEYLVRDLDAEAVFYTPQEFERSFARCAIPTS